MSSKRRIRRRICDSKSPYTLADARRRRTQLWRQGVRNLNIYRCPFCSQYHIGHRPRRYQSPHALDYQAHGRAIARPVERLVVPDSEPDQALKKS